MKLTNTTDGKFYHITAKQVELYKYFQEMSEKSKTFENPNGYFYFTVREYAEKYGNSPAYAHRAISALKVAGAIEYIPRGQGKSIARGVPGFVLTEF